MPHFGLGHSSELGLIHEPSAHFIGFNMEHPFCNGHSSFEFWHEPSGHFTFFSGHSKLSCSLQ